MFKEKGSVASLAFSIAFTVQATVTLYVYGCISTFRVSEPASGSVRGSMIAQHSTSVRFRPKTERREERRG